MKFGFKDIDHALASVARDTVIGARAAASVTAAIQNAAPAVEGITGTIDPVRCENRASGLRGPGFDHKGIERYCHGSGREWPQRSARRPNNLGLQTDLPDVSRSIEDSGPDGFEPNDRTCFNHMGAILRAIKTISTATTKARNVSSDLQYFQENNRRFYEQIQIR